MLEPINTRAQPLRESFVNQRPVSQSCFRRAQSRDARELTAKSHSCAGEISARNLAQRYFPFDFLFQLFGKTRFGNGPDVSKRRLVKHVARHDLQRLLQLEQRTIESRPFLDAAFL